MGRMVSGQGDPTHIPKKQLRTASKRLFEIFILMCEGEIFMLDKALFEANSSAI